MIGMDIWLYFDVTHRHHRYCNPVSEETVRELGVVLGLDTGTRVLDIACGMGEMLIGFAERHGSSGVGVDISPYTLPHAERRKAERVPDADIKLLEMDGKDYRPEPGEVFDVSMCVGASWIWDGFEGTLKALTGLTKPGGLIVSAEPFYRKEPPPEYFEAEDFERETFTTLHGNYEIATRLGLATVWMRGSSEQDWDRYEMDQCAAVDRFARECPDHPDLAEIREKHEKSRDIYLRWGRDHFGFAFWVFRTPEV
ncbi:MAG: SAM-dependent methyltransferase [Planctomycetota bacterium]